MTAFAELKMGKLRIENAEAPQPRLSIFNFQFSIHAAEVVQ